MRAHEALALGIGSPQALNKNDLALFFGLVHPLESSVSLRDDLRTLRKQAYIYLQRANVGDYVKNAKHMLSTTNNNVEAFLREQIAQYRANIAFNNRVLSTFVAELQSTRALKSCLPAHSRSLSKYLLDSQHLLPEDCFSSKTNALHPKMQNLSRKTKPHSTRRKWHIM